MLDWGQVLWGCLSLFWIALFIYKAVQALKGTIIHYYFRNRAETEVGREFSDRDQLKRIEKRIDELENTLRFYLSDSNKPIKNQIKNIQKDIDKIKVKLDIYVDGGEDE